MAKARTTLSADEQAQYRKMMQTVNKRITRLHSEAKKVGYEEITNYAYKGFSRELQGMGMGKYMSKSMPADRKEFRKRMSAMNRFISAPTSSVGGVKKMYEKRAKTMSKKLGLDLTWKDLAKVFETGLWDTLDEAGYGSKSIFRVVAEIHEEKDTLKKKLKAGDSIQFKGEMEKRMLPKVSSKVLKRYLNEIDADEEELPY